MPAKRHRQEALPTQRKHLIPILLAAALVIAALVVVFAVIRPLNAQAAKTQAALDALENATPAPTAAPTPEPTATPEPPWRAQIMRKYNADGERRGLEERDPNGLLLAEEDVYGVRTEYEYDAAGNVVKRTRYQIEKNGDRSLSFWKEYRYNADGKELEELVYHTTGGGESYLDRRFTSTYDAHGNKLRYEKSSRDSGLYEWEDYTYTYDDAGRILRKVCVCTHVSDGAYTETIQNKYDAAGNLVDERHNLVTRMDTMSPFNDRTTYTYNELNQLIKMADSHGSSSVYEYDAAGYRVKVTDYEGGKLFAYTEFERYDNGELRKSTRYNENGTVRSVSCFDVAGNSLGGNVNYEYDAAGRPVRKNEMSLRGDGVTGWTLYEYDGAGRLIRTESYTLRLDGSEQFSNYAEYEYVY